MLNEKATSKAQQQAAAIALSAKRGETDVSELFGSSKQMYDSMSLSDLRDFASTKHGGLPDRVGEEKLREYIRKYIQEILEEDDGINEYAGINIMPANGQVTMGTKGDASFFGPDTKMKGGEKRSVYKVPKSSIHFKDDESGEDDLNPTPTFYDDEEKKKKTFVDTGSVPKTSIHNSRFGERTKKEGMGDASFIGAAGIRKGANDRKPIFKTPKSSIHYKKGRFPDAADFYNDDNWETDKSRPSPNIAGKRPYVGNKSTPKNSIHYDEIPDEDRHYISTQEQLGIPMSADVTIDGGPRSMDPVVGKKTKKKKFADASEYGYPKVEEEKDYDTNIVPKTSIHYGERDKVKGQPKMRFEKNITKEAGFVPDEIKNLKTQGDWKSNLTKAVMDLTGEAHPQEPSIPVPVVGIGDTPEFPYAKDGTMVYPIPGMGTATKNGDEWTFGDTPELPASQEELPSSGCIAVPKEPSTGEVDIPCTQKPMIKKLMMLMKKEQSNLHEGISLRGIYEGKVVKLNTIFEGEHRRFKAFVKTNENKIVKIHFGPTPNEKCLSTEGITRQGSQTREPIGDTDYEVVSKTENEVILKDKETGKKEAWVENDDFAGYVIEIGGRGYEFTHGVNEGYGKMSKKKVNEDMNKNMSFWDFWNYVKNKEMKEADVVIFLYNSIKKGEIPLKTFYEILDDTRNINSQFKDLKRY